MSKEKQNLIPVDPAPTNLSDMANAIDQFHDTIKRALAIPSEEIPPGKDIRITLACKVILVPEVSCHVTTIK